jgi:hypothetical protein
MGFVHSQIRFRIDFAKQTSFTRLGFKRGAGSLARVNLCGDRAKAPRKYITMFHSRLYVVRVGAQRTVRDVAHVEHGSHDLHGLERRGWHEVR